MKGRDQRLEARLLDRVVQPVLGKSQVERSAGATFMAIS